MRLCALLCVFAHAQAYEKAFYSKFICSAPSCVQTDQYRGLANFTVEGNPITFGYRQANMVDSSLYDQFILDCNGWNAFEYNSLPQFETAFNPAVIELRNCPVPNYPLESVLKRFNVTLTPKNNEAYLILKSLPHEPQLKADHFHGLNFISSLSIFAAQSEKEVKPDQRVFASLHALRSLFISGVTLSSQELSHLPRSVYWLRRADARMTSLQETISDTVEAIPSLRFLKLEQKPYAENYELYQLHDELKTDRAYLNIKTYATYDPSESKPALEYVKVLSTWTENKMAPFGHCETLRSISFNKLVTEELPARWVAACPKLEELIVYDSDRITRVPDRLLEGASSLKKFDFTAKDITSLPEGFLNDAHRLESVEVISSKLNALSSSIFQGASATLKKISMPGSELDNRALPAFEGLQALEELWLDDTKFSGELCYSDEFAPLRHLPKLTTLRLPRTVIVCKSWRSLFHALSDLYPYPSWSG